MAVADLQLRRADTLEIVDADIIPARLFDGDAAIGPRLPIIRAIAILRHHVFADGQAEAVIGQIAETMGPGLQIDLAVQTHAKHLAPLGQRRAVEIRIIAQKIRDPPGCGIVVQTLGGETGHPFPVLPRQICQRILHI